MERLEELLDVRLPSISKPTISLFFGLLISLVSVVLLLTAMCSQTWAVRQETVMLQQRKPAQIFTSTKPDTQDADSRVQIKVPVEVPSLQVMLERSKEAAPQFYEGRLNELYTERLNELTREAQSQGEPHTSPLLYKPSVKLKTKRDNEVTLTSIQGDAGIPASIDNGDQKIKILAQERVLPNDGDNTTANEERASVTGTAQTLLSKSLDRSLGRNLSNETSADLKSSAEQFRNVSFPSQLKIVDSQKPDSSKMKTSENNANSTQSKKVVRVIRSYAILKQPSNSSRVDLTITNQLPSPYIKILKLLHDCIQLCCMEKRKFQSIFNKFRRYVILSKFVKMKSLDSRTVQNLNLNSRKLVQSSRNVLLKSPENTPCKTLSLKRITELTRNFPNSFLQSIRKEKNFHLQSTPQSIDNIKLLNSSVQPGTKQDLACIKRLLNSRAEIQRGRSRNKSLFSGVSAPPSQPWHQQAKVLEQKLRLAKHARRERRSPQEEILEPQSHNFRSTRRRPETSRKNFHSMHEAPLGVNSRLARLKRAGTLTRVKSIPSDREEFSHADTELRSAEVLLERGIRYRRSLDDRLREPTDVKYRVCLWRVCITTTRRHSNTTTFCWSVLSSSASGESGASPTSSPAALITSLRYASAAVVAATAMLCLASSIALRAFLIERHTHNLTCPSHSQATASQATPTPVPPSDSTVIIKSPSLNSTSSAGIQHRNFQCKSDASGPSTDEASSSATEASVPWLAGQQHDQFLLPVASALFAVSGITMGGGVFKFCSAMTEKSITSPNDSSHFSSMSSHLSTTLHWPLLLAANCVVGCFLAALAIGYTFFLTWDKQMLNFLNTGSSNDNLIVDQPCERVGGDKKSLCDRCKTKSSTIMEGVAKSLEDSSLAPYQCCQVEYCCNNPTIRHHKSHCSPHVHDVHFSQSVRKQPCMKIANSYHYPARCNHCLNGRETQFGGSSRMPTSSPRVSNNMCDAKFDDSRAKFWSTDLHGNYNPHLHRSVDRYHSHPNDRHHHEEFFRAPVDSLSMQKVVSEAERHVINVCDDPICQREQLRFHRSQSLAEERGAQQLESNLLLSRPKELLKYNDNRAVNVRWKPPFNSKEVFSDGEVEHMYSNFIMQNEAPSFGFPRHSGDRFRIDNKASSCSTQCACDQCVGHISMGAAQADWSGSYIHMSHKERKSRQYFVDTEKSTVSAFQFPHQSLSSLRNNSYSTLPAKFSAKDSFFFQEGRTNHPNREFKSCLNITETSVSSFDLIKNNSNLINGNAKQNSSAPSLKAKIDEFDKRKLVKTVKFITPDDEDSDSDSDYYVKKSSQNNIKKIRRDFLAADGSSPIRELCGNSPLYR